MTAGKSSLRRLNPAGVEVRDLAFRWGSCGKSETLNFHWAHLVEKNHTLQYWRKVERVLPNCEEGRRWLAERGAEVVGI